MAQYLVEQHLAGFHVRNNRGARKSSQNLAGENGQYLVTPNDFPVAVDDPQAIAIAIESETGA